MTIVDFKSTNDTTHLNSRANVRDRDAADCAGKETVQRFPKFHSGSSINGAAKSAVILSEVEGPLRATDLNGIAESSR
jgi:hypothetical protein